MERDNIVKLKMLKGKAEKKAAEEEAKKNVELAATSAKASA